MTGVKTTGAVLLATAMMVVVYRKRKAIGTWSDAARAAAVGHIPGVENAIETVTAIRYGNPADIVDLARAQQAERVADPKKPWEKYIANVGPDGVTLSEIQTHARETGQAVPWELTVSTVALQANHSAIRRHAQAKKAQEA